ncbi:MAG TPA: serine/threonine-protein kinase, partial [Myxococcaceae bacterium]|nr:serine/threonine-protein kinase [Myxococcaceae bacterium]
MECFDDEMLARMREGRLPPEEARRIAEHASGCERCTERLEEADRRRTLVERHTQVIDTGNPTVSLRQTGREEVPELVRGTPLDRYVVLELLGKGGMGAVYAAYDSVLDRKVALKLLPPGEAEGLGEVSTGRARLLREATAMASLNHPNVVAVYDVHQHGAQVFMAMELVDGQTLKQWLREEPRSWREILSAFLAAGRGLAAAHAAGLIHRDFKPANVLVGRDGRVRVTDFGLARRRAAPPPEPSSPESPGESTSSPVFASPLAPHNLLELELTQNGARMGTPAYMSPEQHRGLPADARSDQFSFALALWEALYGEHPFDGDFSATRRDNVLAGRLRPPPAHSKVPPWVHRALVRALSLHPEERYPSLDTLLAILERDPVQVRRRRLATSAILLLVAGSGLLAYSGWQQR